MSTEDTLKLFIKLNDEQKLEVIRKLENIKETPAEIISGLKMIHELSKEKTVQAMYEFIGGK